MQPPPARGQGHTVPGVVGGATDHGRGERRGDRRPRRLPRSRRIQVTARRGESTAQRQPGADGASRGCFPGL